MKVRTKKKNPLLYTIAQNNEKCPVSYVYSFSKFLPKLDMILK